MDHKRRRSWNMAVRREFLQRQANFRQRLDNMPQQEDRTLNDRNLSSISKIDPFVAEIVDQTVHVALYDFDVETRSWKRREIAGPFFIYRRKAKPFYSFMIANRHSPNDYIHPILTTIQFELNMPFIFVNLSKNKIIGLWFSTNEECKKIYEHLELLKQS